MFPSVSCYRNPFEGWDISEIQRQSSQDGVIYLYCHQNDACRKIKIYIKEISPDTDFKDQKERNRKIKEYTLMHASIYHRHINFKE